MKTWVGIDLGETSASYCVIDDDGVLAFEGKCGCDAVAIHQALTEFSRYPIELIGLEAGVGTRQARQLRNLGYSVGVFEARTVRRFLSAFANKTDSSDARGIAEIARHGASVVPRVYVKSAECQHLRSELNLRYKMKQQKVALQAMIRSLFRLHSGARIAPRRGMTLRQLADQEIAELVAREGIDLSEQIHPILDLYDGINGYLKKLDVKLQALVREHPVCSRLATIPGVGFLSALSFYSAIEDADRFSRVDSVGAYLGLTPKVHQSGTMTRRMGISKRGSKLTRGHLVLGARSLLRAPVQDTAIKQWGLKVAARSGSSKAQIAVARKLAVIMLTVWKTGRAYEPFPNKR